MCGLLKYCAARHPQLLGFKLKKIFAVSLFKVMGNIFQTFSTIIFMFPHHFSCRRDTMSAASQLKQLMSIIDKYSHAMTENDYLVACNLLNDQFKNTESGVVTSYTSRIHAMEDMSNSSESMTTNMSICRETLEALDGFVFESRINMELDVQYKRYRCDFQRWESREKNDETIPRSYEAECVALYRLAHGMSLEIDGEFSIVDLRRIGALREDDVSDDDFLRGQFGNLDLWYETSMKCDVYAMDTAWCRFTSSKCFIDVMKMLQDGIKAIEWRRRIHLNLNKSMIFAEVDSRHDGLHVHMPWISILPESEASIAVDDS